MKARAHPAVPSAYSAWHRPSQGARIWCAWLLAICLLGTQWLGLAHAIEHYGWTGGRSEAVASMPAASVAGPSHGLHADHNCTLFDALALASCAGSPAALHIDLPAPRVVATAWRSQFRAISAPAPYDSRAPPATLS